MKFLRIDELQPGAIAAKDVRDVSGRRSEERRVGKEC